MMTPSSPSITRKFGALTMAFLFTVFTFGVTVAPSSAEARGTGAYYTAELAAPATETQAIVKGVVWTCEGNVCVAAKNNSRDDMTCKRFVRKFGAVTSFTVQDEAFSEEKLAKCNA